MKAETAYNVIEALDPIEKKRLFKMLGVDQPKVRIYKKRKPLLSDAEATEYLLRRLKK